jgi:hypothetical protein
VRESNIKLPTVAKQSIVFGFAIGNFGRWIFLGAFIILHLAGAHYTYARMSCLEPLKEQFSPA